MCTSAASFPEGEDAIGSDGVVEVRMTVDESGDVSMLSGEVQKWFTLHAELPVETLMDPALLIANTHILFNPKRGDIKVSLFSRQRSVAFCCGKLECVCDVASAMLGCDESGGCLQGTCLRSLDE